MVRLINEALDKLPVHRGVVYRNIGFYAKDEFEAFVESLSTGAVEGKAFTSASKIKGAYDVEMPYNAHYEIESITGRDIEQYGEQSEKEVLFKRCTLFEVVNVRVSENTAYVVLKESASNEITDTGYEFDDSQNFNGNSRQAGYEGRSEELSVRASAVRGGSSAYDKVFQKQSRSNGGAGYGGSRRYNAGSDQKAGNDSYTEGYDVSDWLSAQYIHDGKSKTGVGKRVKNIMQLCIALIKSPLLA